jgi:hypothetical protein
MTRGGTFPTAPVAHLGVNFSGAECMLYKIKDTVMDVVRRLLFVAAWICMLLGQVDISAKGPEGERTTASSNLGAKKVN